MPKISELTTALASDINNDDLLVIVDKYTGETKNMPITEFAKVMADILGVDITGDAGEDKFERPVLPRLRNCGTKVVLQKMISSTMVDRYRFDTNSNTFTITYDTYLIGNRITLYASSSLNPSQKVMLFDTGGEISGQGSATFCKDAGYDIIDVYIRSKSLASFEYTLSCGLGTCDYVQPIPVTPTPSYTPPVTPTVTATNLVIEPIVDPTPTPTTTNTPTPSPTQLPPPPPPLPPPPPPLPPPPLPPPPPPPA